MNEDFDHGLGEIDGGDDERVYSAPFEDESFADSEDDESLAATQEAFEQERRNLDEAVSAYRGADLRDDGHEAEREELQGNGLLWWRDTSLLAAHHGMADLFDELLTQFDRSKELIESGVPEETMTVHLPLNFFTGPMVLAGLQLLGLYVPELRETIARILKTFPFPVATEEETALIDETIKSLMEKRTEEFVAHLRDSRDEDDDAELGLGLN